MDFPFLTVTIFAICRKGNRVRKDAIKGVKDRKKMTSRRDALLTTKYQIQPALDIEITEDGRLRIYDAGKLTYTLSTQEALGLTLWLRQFQNYLALANVQQDQRHAMMAEIEQESEDKKEMSHYDD